MEAATDLGIQVCGTRDVGHLTAELTLGMILALARQTSHEERALREGRWQVRLGHSVRGKTLGVLGLGDLGKQVAAFGRMLVMETIAWSQNLDAKAAAEASCRLVGRDELFRAADYLSIHVRLSDRTRGLVGTRELGLMKPTAYLINTSRGPIVDERALFECLRDKRIAGAALDVYGKEPLPMDDPSAPSTMSFCCHTWGTFPKKTIAACMAMAWRRSRRSWRGRRCAHSTCQQNEAGSGPFEAKILIRIVVETLGATVVLLGRLS